MTTTVTEIRRYVNRRIGETQQVREATYVGPCGLDEGVVTFDGCEQDLTAERLIDHAPGSSVAIVGGTIIGAPSQTTGVPAVATRPLAGAPYSVPYIALYVDPGVANDSGDSGRSFALAHPVLADGTFVSETPITLLDQTIFTARAAGHPDLGSPTFGIANLHLEHISLDVTGLVPPNTLIWCDIGNGNAAFPSSINRWTPTTGAFAKLTSVQNPSNEDNWFGPNYIDDGENPPGLYVFENTNDGSDVIRLVRMNTDLSGAPVVISTFTPPPLHEFVTATALIDGAVLAFARTFGRGEGTRIRFPLDGSDPDLAAFTWLVPNTGAGGVEHAQGRRTTNGRSVLVSRTSSRSSTMTTVKAPGESNDFMPLSSAYDAVQGGLQLPLDPLGERFVQPQAGALSGNGLILHAKRSDFPPTPEPFEIAKATEIFPVGEPDEMPVAILLPLG